LPVARCPLPVARCPLPVARYLTKQSKATITSKRLFASKFSVKSRNVASFDVDNLVRRENGEKRPNCMNANGVKQWIDC
jgi:hypothetical protein